YTRSKRDWSSDVCSSDLETIFPQRTTGSLRESPLPRVGDRDAVGTRALSAPCALPAPCVAVPGASAGRPAHGEAGLVLLRDGVCAGLRPRVGLPNGERLS